MRSTWIMGAAAMSVGAMAVAGAAWAEPSLEIKSAAVRVMVIPEARSDVNVKVLTASQALPVSITTEGNRVVVDGGLRHRIAGCSAMFGKTTVHVRGLGQVSYDNLPQIVARVPMDARVEASGAVFGSVGRSDSLVLSNAGCGDWTVANVKGALKVNQAGSGDTRAGNAGQLVVHVAGSGDVIAREVGGSATVDIAGSGDVSADSMSGPLKANIAGSGDVKVAQGHASEMVVHIAGSGDVKFGGVAESLNASVAGSGDVVVGKVTGPVKKSILGSGDVTVGG